MNSVLDAFWRAAAYCLRPGIIVLSLLPLILMLTVAVLFGNFLWEPALGWVRDMLASTELLRSLWAWLASVGLGPAQTVVANLLVIFAVTPLIVVGSLLLVALLMTPMLVRLVARRRFPSLQVAGSAGFVASLLWGGGSAALALLAMLVTLPLWLIPPLALVLPPLIWGWLTYRVMAFDALSSHASTDERHTILHQHRANLLGMGIFCGFLGGAPGLMWVSGPVIATMFPLLVPLAVWMYALVFVFSSLWFAHYGLAALQALRSQAPIPEPSVPLAPLELTQERPMRQLLEP